MVLPYINMNPPRVYTCSQFWTPPPTSRFADAWWKPSRGVCRRDLFIFSFYLFFYWFIWLHQVFVSARSIFSCGMWTRSCSIWDLVLSTGIEPRPLQWQRGLSHWTTRESQDFQFKNTVPLEPCAYQQLFLVNQRKHLELKTAKPPDAALLSNSSLFALHVRIKIVLSKRS